MSTIGSANVRRGATAASAVSSGPLYIAATTTIGLPCTDSGRKGTGGAVVRLTSDVSSSGIVSVSPRQLVMTVRAASGGKKSSPAMTVGPTWCSSNSNDVTMPKLPPPPRSAQNRSGLSVALACTSWPSDVTTSAPTRLSAAKPYFPHNPADTATEGEPADAGARDESAGDGEAERLRLVVDMSPGRPALDRRAMRRRVDGDGVHGRQVDDDTVVDGREAGDAVSAAAHR